MSIIIRDISYLVRRAGQVETDCDLLLDGNRIVEIGKNLPAPVGASELQGRGCVVMPGWVNAHTHLYQNFLKGVSAGIPLVPWCNEVLFPTVGALREAFTAGNRQPAYLWSIAAAIEMIKSGTTCCLDMDVTMAETVKAWQDIGLRGVAAYTLTNKWVPEELRSQEEEMRRSTLRFVETWHHPQGLTQVSLAPSTLFLCDESLLAWVRAQAEQLDLGIQIHISEIASEVEDSLHEYGLRPVERLEQLGLITPRLSAVHCVHVNQKEIDHLAAGGAYGVHCPKSNMKLADGIAPVAVLRKAGVPISIATDGCGSNDLLDMWEETRAALLLARVANDDAAVLSAEEVFQMSTEVGAEICHIDAGRLDPGRLADLIIVELKGAHLRPFHADRLFDMLVFCGRAQDVRDVIINGEIVLQNRTIVKIDEDALMQEIEETEGPLYQRRAALRYTAS